MRKGRSSGILVILTSVLVFSACAAQPEPIDCAKEDVFCAGLVTAFDGIEDHGLNQAAWEALQSVKEQAQIARLDVIASVDMRDWQKNIEFFADQGYDVIVTVGRNLGETTTDEARRYPRTFFVGIDQQIEQTQLIQTNLAIIFFQEEQAGFLAGVLAASLTESGNIGAVCETGGIDSVWRFCEGFRAGALHEDKELLISVAYREDQSRDDTFNDPEWGEENALHQIESGVDVLTGFGGNTANGAFLAASQKGVLVIGSEEDLYYHLPDVQPVLVTSFIKDPGTELAGLIFRASQGERPAGAYVGQIKQAPFRGPHQDIQNEATKKMEEIIQKIKDGDIEITLPEKK